MKKWVGTIGVSAILASALVGLGGSAANADEPSPSIDLSFIAPTCAGTTDFDPTQNTGFAVADTTQMFGERLQAYNAGSVVPLYDAYGGSTLLSADGTLSGIGAAYPPQCGTRYVAAAGGPVSEWMFCTDRHSQTCGDTDSEGRLVDESGAPVAPMTNLSGNPKFIDAPEQEKLVAYLITHGHAYAGIGNQAFGGVLVARSDGSSNERAALQTLVWCISDPAPSDSMTDFAATCEANMGAAEQARLLSMIPDVPDLLLEFGQAGNTLKVGQTAEFSLTTNLFNQPISIETGGTAAANWAVCSGDGSLENGTLTVSGTDPNTSVQIGICASATAAGSVSIAATAHPASTQHIGWSQSINPELVKPCQVYATFHAINKSDVRSESSAIFEAAVTPDPKPEPKPEPKPAVSSKLTGAKLANTGSGDQLILWLAFGFLVLGSVALAGSARRTRALESGNRGGE